MPMLSPFMKRIVHSCLGEDLFNLDDGHFSSQKNLLTITMWSLRRKCPMQHRSMGYETMFRARTLCLSKGVRFWKYVLHFTQCKRPNFFFHWQIINTTWENGEIMMEQFPLCHCDYFFGTHLNVFFIKKKESITNSNKKTRVPPHLSTPLTHPRLTVSLTQGVGIRVTCICGSLANVATMGRYQFMSVTSH
jgi:hypothetical protein